ncbi:MAG: dipeptidase [Armatimonadota bacterium]|nr:dipeptidase [Armatimonadota bacterium]MDR7532973.1 dipeptidase [Armatimonadota bacterium]
MSAGASVFPPIFDGHNDTILSLVRTGRSFFERSEIGHVDLPRARQGGLGGGFFAIYLRDPALADVSAADGAALERALHIYGDEARWPEPMALDYAQPAALDLFGRLLRLERHAGGLVRIVRTAAELQACLDGGVFAMLIHFEGAEPLDPDGHALDVFHAAGLRSVGLTHSRRNRYAQGVPFKFPHSPDTGPGLTDAGKALVRQLNERRIMIDLSHLTERGFWDVAAISDAPLVATHSNAHALCPSPRNLTDRQLDAIRERRGVVGLNFHVGFLRADGARDPAVPIARMVEHIDYMVDRMGLDCVALGSDFDGAVMPADLHDASGLPRLLQALAARGYAHDDLRRIAHGNWVRVLRETWGA